MSKTLSVLRREAIEFTPVDSLRKIFMKREPLEAPTLRRLDAFRGQDVSFQAAYRYTEPYHSYQMQVQATKNPSVRVEAEVCAEGGTAPTLTIRRVGYVPSCYPAYGEADSGYITTEPGLFPDPLEELGEDPVIQLIPYYWRSLWIEVHVPEEIPAGDYPIRLSLSDLSGNLLVSRQVTLHIVDQLLPPQSILHTEWFHADCLADYYHVPVFSESFWEIVSNYMETAVRRGMNMILTPLFSLPLDTLIGTHRTPVQLVRVMCTGEGGYRFDYERLDRWIMIARRSGFAWFEMGHLFSQWGARYAPLVQAEDADGSEYELFGWNTIASGPEYAGFLHQFLPSLTAHLETLGIADVTYYHISDEPNEQNIDTYRLARQIVDKDLAGRPILDALSTLDYYTEGLVNYPVPTTEHIEEFLQHGMAHPWVYYCSGEYLQCTNRFYAMPSARLRILGVQMYLAGIEGFLHWGYNFYNSQYSRRHLNPYITTDADDAFPSGDSFLVYPGEDGRPVESLRLLTLQEAFDDVRILQLLEELTDRDTVTELIVALAGMQITFSHYPQDAAFLLTLRAEAIRRIEAAYENGGDK